VDVAGAAGHGIGLRVGGVLKLVDFADGLAELAAELRCLSAPPGLTMARSMRSI
jgi:hypothetical protein